MFYSMSEAFLPTMTALGVYYWQQVAVLWILAVLSMTFVGLWCIWGGLGRQNWFVRVAVVFGWISLLLVIPAYELVIEFLVQAVVTIAMLLVWRHWHAARHGTAVADELGTKTALRPWQFSIRDLMLLTVLVSWASAMVARAPGNAWHSLPPLAEGAVAGFFTLAAAWIALGKGRWWLRLPVFLLLLPSALMVAWLVLARSAGFARSPGGKSWKVRLSRVGLVLVSLLILVPTANLYWRLARPLPIPATTLPNPNGYDDLVKAGKILGAAGVPTLETATHAQFKAFVEQNGQGFALVQTGLSRPCQRPPTFAIDLRPRLPENQALRELALSQANPEGFVWVVA